MVQTNQFQLAICNRDYQEGVPTFYTLLFSYLLILVQQKLVHMYFETRGHTLKGPILNFVHAILMPC